MYGKHAYDNKDKRQNVKECKQAATDGFDKKGKKSCKKVKFCQTSNGMIGEEKC